jgi:DNA-directed RNA polymerase subunit RPC12/RpoP
MASLAQLNPYRCDQCGTTNIVAAPVVYQQGTRAYSGTFSSGTSQSYCAQAASPPRPRGYLRPLVLWGPAFFILCVWTVVGFSSILEHPTTTALRPNTVALFLFLSVISLAGLAMSFRKIARYNREVYPRLHWDWEHTYICKRCGKPQLIHS